MKMKLFAAKNPKLQLNKKEFLNLFNNHMNICVLSEGEKRKYICWEEFQKKKN